MSRDDVKKVTVSLTGIHENSGDEEISDVCEGTLIYREPYYFVTYEEKIDKESRELTKTLLRYNEESLKVTRKGNAVSELIFVKGKTHKCEYATEMGSFDIEIITDDFLYENDGETTKIEASYRLGLNGMRPSESHMSLKIDRK